MINELKESLWKQFGAGIDMLKNAIKLWPEEYWIFLEYYLNFPTRNFSSALPFTISESDCIPVDTIDDLVPDAVKNVIR